jgi:hypothetical protein
MNSNNATYQLAGLLFRVLDIIAEPTNSVVSVVLGGRHPCELNKGEEEKDLKESSGRDGTDSVDTGRDIRELWLWR